MFYREILEEYEREQFQLDMEKEIETDSDDLEEDEPLFGLCEGGEGSQSQEFEEEISKRRHKNYSFIDGLRGIGALAVYVHNFYLNFMAPQTKEESE